MKTIDDHANEYVGHGPEPDEDLSVYQKREAFKAGMNTAFNLVREQLGYTLIKDLKHPILHVYGYIDKKQGKASPPTPLQRARGVDR